jgi:DNA (cytosine-5)-methyltransferase 1
MTAFGQYEDDDSGSTCKQRDYKDATDLVVQPVCATGPRTHTLKAEGFDGSEDGTGRGTPIVPAVLPFDTTQITSPSNYSRPKAGDPCHPLASRAHPPAIAFYPTQDPISSVEVTHALGTGSKGGCATAAVAMINMQGSKGNAVAQADGPSYTLNAMHGHDVHAVAVAMINMQATKPHAVAFAQNTRDEVRLIGGDGQVVGALAAQPGMKQTTYLAVEVTGTLGARASSGGGFSTDFEVAGGLQPVGFDPTGSTANVGLNLSPTLRGSGVAGNAGHHAAVSAPPMAVRRLLPVECERLQGFPDDHTNIPWRGKPAPDGPRYKAMGNSMAVPVMRWIGERLDRVAKEKR